MATEPINPTPEGMSLEPNTLRPLAEVFAQRSKYARRGDYRLLGRLQYVMAEQGLIDFGKDGPALAQFTAGDADVLGAIAILEPWAGFPTRMALLPDLCDDCRHLCIECADKYGQPTGQHICKHPGCGGRGYLVASVKKCPAWRCRKAPNPKCKQCFGQGLVPDKKAECPCCHGTLVQTCVRCRGTLHMSTGKIGGSLDPDAGLCPKCDGNGRKRTPTPQAYGDFLRGELEGFTVLGPIGRLMLISLPGDEPGYSIVEFRPDADGNLPCFMVQDPEKRGQNWYLFGGAEAKIEFHPTHPAA